MSLRTRSLTVRLGGTTILDGVDLEASPGAITAIIGPNGAGKSTLLRTLAGFEKPTSGGVTVDGRPIEDITLSQLARKRAYMSPNPPESVDFPVREVVAMGRHPWTTTRQESDAAVARGIEDMDLTQLADQPVSSLSTGEARRAQVARLLAQEVPIMLADEPVNGLDVGYSEMVLARLRKAARQDRTVVCVLHDLNAAAQFAGHIVLLDQGRIVSAGSPGEVLTEELLSAVYRHPVTVMDHPGRTGLAILAGEDPQPRSQR